MRRDQVPERLEHPQHQRDRRVGERPELRVGLLGMSEVALHHLQQDLVADVEQVTAPGRHSLGDSRDGFVVLAAPNGREHHRADRIELGVGREHLAVLVEDLYELAEMGLLPVAARALSLLEDRVHRLLCAREVGDRDELGPAKVRRARLGARGPDEQVLLAELLSQVSEALLDRAVEVTDGREVLGLRDDVALGHQRHRFVNGRVDALSASERHALGALQEHEMPQCLLSERDQRQVHSGRIVVSGSRKVRPAEVGGSADRRQQVVHQRQVEHLLASRRAICRAASDRPLRARASVSPSSSLCLSEKAANRYWHMIPCSSSAASHSM